jgi:cytochrome oxidase Cu insertion factor (SCO1/SenC/PrrC family)
VQVPESKGDFESTPTPAATADAATVDRAAAFAAGPQKIPRKTIVAFIACLAVLGLGGVVLDHFFSGSAGTSTTATPAGAYPPPLQTATTTTPAVTGTPATSQLPATSSALMALERMTPRAAPGFSLTDEHGRSVSLASFRGKVVVLSFFDAACDDICPVLSTELSQAYRDLGPDASRVALLTVNTDPLALTPASAAPAEKAADISAAADWHFLTGSLSQLDSEWRSYGIAVEVQRSTRVVSHSEGLYFIDSAGRLRFRATPFADESSAGVVSLPRVTETAWAAGIADLARSLLDEKP